MRQAVRWPGLLLAVLLLAACGGRHAVRPPGAGSTGGHHGWFHRGVDDDTRLPQDRRYRDRDDSTPDGAPPAFIATLPEPVPKAEPRALYGNKSPYSVRGQTYRVLPSAAGYDERGIASYYGNKFDGYKTSSLENYDMYKFSAASKVLPLPSYARVTNLANGKSVVVRVNDRGPFHENRIIDLSYAAAVRIGIWPKGTGLVEVQGIDPSGGVRELPLPPVVTGGAARPGIYLQVGAFADPANAERVAQQLRQANLAPVQVIDADVGGHRVRRVRLGPLADAEAADRASDRIERMGLPHPEVAVD
ncbi:septal ring lytic transglycosylase RlpA family protein [Fulvimonas sp. R45]|uniref:septal ring lytic transglycosylase RlpA family protein n=1 Tax=Fulvimonas sp. R45 TaxID=3045937 RepID=UPI00265DFADD|nr:septal ring lytic transglycosylase RlpA family protein [Fulvimonas sp. R45]MDO1527687.1 septal ring lytic transglycosylase RlpA family protein [Fulvimonas sp. R45]